MKKFYEKVVFFLTRKERGATAVEYALMVGLIAVAIIAVVAALGGGLNNAFQTITDAISGVGA